MSELKNLIVNGDTRINGDLYADNIEENEEVVAAALNDLNTRLLSLEQSLLELTNQILN